MTKKKAAKADVMKTVEQVVGYRPITGVAGAGGETPGPAGPGKVAELPADQQTARRAEFVKPTPSKACPGHKYRRLITPLDGGPPVVVDVYSVLQAFGVTCQARGHAVKKALMAGARGSKTARQDLEEAIVALRRSIDFTPPDCPPERSWRLVGGDATPPGGL